MTPPHISLPLVLPLQCLVALFSPLECSLERHELFCMYLAHHEQESAVIVISII